MKSKMPCPPAFIPVIKFDHATGLCGGMLVVSRRNDPCEASLEKLGILPFVHELLQELRIHAVDAEDDQLLLSLPVAARMLAREQQGSGGKDQQSSKYPDNFFRGSLLLIFNSRHNRSFRHELRMLACFPSNLTRH